MTSLSRRFWLGAGIAAIAGLAQAQSSAKDPLAPLPEGAARAQPASGIQAPPRIAPASLRDRLNGLGRSFNGKAGISVVSLKDGWQADYNSTALFPQQSCSKLWVAITAMDAVDKGRISLNDRVTLGRSDLTLFHQPVSAKVLGKGGHTTTLGNLLFTVQLYGQEPPHLTHGPVLGRLSAHGIGVWGRTNRPGQFAVAYGRQPDNLSEVSALVATQLAHDNTAWIHLSGLQANTRYYYKKFKASITM